MTRASVGTVRTEKRRKGDTFVDKDQQHSLIWVYGKEESRMTSKVFGSNLPVVSFSETGKTVQGVHRLGGGG